MISYISSNQREWATIAPGVEFAVVRQAGEAQTLFVRMKKGAHAPMHTHDGGEETCLLSGRLRVGELMLNPGDYLWTPPGVEHEGHAEEDTLFFVILPKGLRAT